MIREDKKFTAEVKKNIDSWFSLWSANNERAKWFTRFIMETQWEDKEKQALESSDATPLEFNKLGAIINNILGDQRQNTPNLQVVCTSDDVTAEQVSLVQQILKTIAFNTEARVAYQHAFQCALVAGYGAFCIDTEYESEDSFDQCIAIRKIDDPSKCFWDPSATGTAKTDGGFAGRYYTMSRREWKKRYPKYKDIESTTLPSSGYSWVDDKSMMLVDYFKKEMKVKQIVMLSDGQKMAKTDYDKLAAESLAIGMPVPEIIKERETLETTIKRYKIAGDHILEETEWPAKAFGIIFVDQNSAIIDNKQVTRPFVKDAVDAQRVVNHLGTKITYLIKATRYDQWLATPTNIAGQDAVWRNPGQYQGALVFTPEVVAGNVIIPKQLTPPELSQSLMMQFQRAERDITTCLGIYETQLGGQGNESSGVAIAARVKRGNTSTFVTFDALNRAIAEAGDVIAQLIPRIYDTPRNLMIDTPEHGLRSVAINKPIYNGQYQGGIDKDVTKGEYKIHLDAGSSFEGQKAEYIAAMQQIFSLDPGMFKLCADLYVEELPSKNVKEMVGRFKTIVPPDVIAAGKGEPPKPKPPQQPDPMMMMKMQELEIQKANVENEKAKNETDRMTIELKRDEQELRKKELTVRAAEAIAKVESQQISAEAEVAKAHIEGDTAQMSAMVNLSNHQVKIAEIINKSKELINGK